MVGRIPVFSRNEQNDWISLTDLIEEVAGNYVPCMNYPDLFFQDLKGPEAIHNQKMAKELCSGCPIINECLAFALKHNEPFGIWGGLSPYERKLLKNKKSK